MNADAEKKIWELRSDYGGTPSFEALRAAMAWAYADAAKVCIEQGPVIGEPRAGHIARAIEARMKR